MYSSPHVVHSALYTKFLVLQGIPERHDMHSHLLLVFLGLLRSDFNGIPDWTTILILRPDCFMILFILSVKASEMYGIL